ncbi:MAG: hypothetical protein ACYDCQ_16715 [Dehalococcoidia bacterium]
MHQAALAARQQFDDTVGQRRGIVAGTALAAFVIAAGIVFAVAGHAVEGAGMVGATAVALIGATAYRKSQAPADPEQRANDSA